jgi:hypothetical protein
MDIRAKIRDLRVFSACVVLVAAAVSTVPAAAQALGELKGRVRDSSGAAITAADITLTLTASDVSQTAKTTSTGAYDFPQLTPGIYSIHVSHPGFEPVDREGGTITTPDPIRLDITLKASGVGKTMMVMSTPDTSSRIWANTWRPYLIHRVQPGAKNESFVL